MTLSGTEQHLRKNEKRHTSKRLNYCQNCCHTMQSSEHVCVYMPNGVCMNMHAQVSVYGLIGVHVELMSGSVGGCVSLTEVQTCGLCCSGSLTCRPDRSMRSWFDFRVHTVHVVRGNTD